MRDQHDSITHFSLILYDMHLKIVKKKLSNTYLFKLGSRVCMCMSLRQPIIFIMITFKNLNTRVTWEIDENWLKILFIVTTIQNETELYLQTHNNYTVKVLPEQKKCEKNIIIIIIYNYYYLGRRTKFSAQFTFCIYYTLRWTNTHTLNDYFRKNVC